MRTSYIGLAMFLLMLHSSVQSQETLTGQLLQQKIQTTQQNLIAQGFAVKYQIVRNISRNDPALKTVQLPGTKTPEPFWRTEMARKGDWTYHMLSASPPEIPTDKDKTAQVRIFTDNYGWIFNTSFQSVNLGRKESLSLMKKALYPIEDIYSEIIGIAPSCEGIYNTFGVIGTNEPTKQRISSLTDTFKEELLKNEKVDTEVLDGVRCFVLNRNGLGRAWVSPEYGYSLVKREWRWNPNKPLKVVVKNTNFKQISTSDNLWLPTQSKIDYYGDHKTNPDQVCMTATLNVSDMSYKIPDESFSPKLKPGTEIHEFGTSPMKMWYMPSNEESLETIINNSSKYLKPEPVLTSSQGVKSFKKILLINLALAILLAAAILARRCLYKPKASG